MVCRRWVVPTSLLCFISLVTNIPGVYVLQFVGRAFSLHIRKCCHLTWHCLWSLMQTTRVYAISVAFDLKNDYKVPLSGMELDSGIPNVSLMDGKPVYLQLHLVGGHRTFFQFEDSVC